MAGRKPKLAELLIAKGADPAAKDRNGSTLLHSAAQLGDVQIMRGLPASGLDVNAKTAKAQAGRGICAVIRFLAGKGADLTAADTTGTRPLTLAAAVDGAADLIKQLIEAPAQQPR